jgi:hypothetical protein
MQNPEPAITTPDATERLDRFAATRPGQPQVVLPGPLAAAGGEEALPDPRALRARKTHKASLLRRGLRLFSLTFGIAAAWFVYAWIRDGWMPRGLGPPQGIHSFDAHADLAYPPEELLALLGFLLLLSLSMMLFGSHNPFPRRKT